VAVLALLAAGVLTYVARTSLTTLTAEKAAVLTDLQDARERNYDLLKILAEREATLSEFQGTNSLTPTKSF
jgi:hypothetical protein